MARNVITMRIFIGQLPACSVLINVLLLPSVTLPGNKPVVRARTLGGVRAVPSSVAPLVRAMEGSARFCSRRCFLSP